MMSLVVTLTLFPVTERVTLTTSTLWFECIFLHSSYFQCPTCLSMYVLYVQKLLSLVSISAGSGVLALKTRLVCLFMWKANGFIYLLCNQYQNTMYI